MKIDTFVPFLEGENSEYIFGGVIVGVLVAVIGIRHYEVQKRQKEEKHMLHIAEKRVEKERHQLASKSGKLKREILF